MTNHSDFSQRPLIAGSLIGLRAFDVHGGVLHGCSFPHPFRAGVNEAECHDPMGFRLRQRVMHTLTRPAVTLWFIPGGNYPRPTEEPLESKPHTLASVDCGCGFWAYFDGSNEYYEDWVQAVAEERDAGNAPPPEVEFARVEALIEGFGTCTVGPRGFRATKARLAALILPDHSRRKLRFYEWFLPILLALNIAGLALNLALGSWWAMGNAVAVAYAGRETYRARSRYIQALRRQRAPHPYAEVLAENYPGVPIYATRKAALAAHPLTPVTSEDRA